MNKITKVLVIIGILISQLQANGQISLTWNELVTLPATGGSFSAVEYSGDIYVFGMVLNTKAHKYSISSNSFTELAIAPYHNLDGDAVVYNDLIYIVGNSGKMQIYNPNTNSWEQGIPKPTTTLYHTCSLYENKIYFFGGVGGENLVEIYNPVTNTWTTGANIPTGRSELQSVVYDNKIYVAGGDGSSYLDIVDIYDPVTDTWKVGMPFFRGRESFLLANIDDRLIAIGGDSNNYIEIFHKHGYNMMWDEWYSFQNDAIPTHFGYFGAASIGRSMYFFGGSSDGSYNTNVIRIDLDQDEACSNSVTTLFPKNGATGMPVTMKFDWESYPMSIIRSSYEVEITNNSGQMVCDTGLISSQLEFTNFSTSPFEENQTYNMRIRTLTYGYPSSNWSANTQFTIKGTTPVSPNYGAALGHFNDAVIYKNRNDYTGTWQCVEYAKRYNNIVYLTNTVMPAMGGNAEIWYNSPKLGFGRFSNSNGGSSFIPQIGDIVCLNKSATRPYGHVAIVNNVVFSDDSNNSNDFVYVTQQNVGTNINQHLSQEVGLNYNNGKFTIDNFVGKPVQGWRRAMPTVISPTGNAVYNTDNVLVKWVPQPNAKEFIVNISKENEITGCYEPIHGYTPATCYGNYYYFPDNILEANSRYRLRVTVVTAFDGYAQTQPIYFDVASVSKGSDDLFSNMSIYAEKQTSNGRIDAVNVLVQEVYNGLYIDKGVTNEYGVTGFETAPAFVVGDTIAFSVAGIEPQEVYLTQEMIDTGYVHVVLQEIDDYQYITDASVEILNYQPIYTENTVNLKITANNHTGYQIVDFENSNDTLTIYNDFSADEIFIDYTIPEEGLNSIHVYFIGQDTIEVVKEVVYIAEPTGNDFNTVTIISDANSINSEIYLNGSYLKNIENSIETAVVPLGQQEFSFVKEDFAPVTAFTNSTETINLAIEPFVGINNIEKQDKITVYPNPANDLITVRLENIENRNIEIKLFDFTGKAIKMINVNAQNEIQINTRDLTNGVYYLNIMIDNERITTKKVIIMK